MRWIADQRFIYAILVPTFCLWPMLGSMGCGQAYTPTLESNPRDDGDTAPPDEGDTDLPDNDDPIADPPDDDGTADDVDPVDDMPVNDYCDAVSDWDPQWVEFENEVLELVNQQRAAGAVCGDQGSFDPADPLTMNAALRCAARNHSMDMGLRDYFDHYSPEGGGPGERFDQAEFSGSSWAENIAWGYRTPEAVVAGWMNSPGHCSNIMRAQLTETGVGYYEGALWTQTFGRP